LDVIVFMMVCTINSAFEHFSFLSPIPDLLVLASGFSAIIRASEAKPHAFLFNCF
jgi:hypothetical protein